MAAIPIFTTGQLQAICKVLADTNEGLTGTELDQLLPGVGIEDVAPSMSKWKRLFEALKARQKQDHCGNNVVAFVHAAMEPVRYQKDSTGFEERRTALNQALVFCGLNCGKDGKLTQTEPATTIEEAQTRAGRLRKALQDRAVHPDVLAFCRAELLQDNYFHAVFEATKSVAEKIRNKSGLTSDGSDLVDKAFGLASGIPLLAFNSLQTETEQSEHKGLMHLIKGMFGVFRNVTAHAPKVIWPIVEQDAMDLLVLASFLHRRLDNAVSTRRVAQ
jgi:uncharacterized protein (TIGR02391 family)